MNQLDSIKKLCDMYSEEKETLRIVELMDDGIDLDSDIEELTNLYLEL